MKIAVTITDASMAANVGGPVESLTAIIELSDDQIPPILKRHLEARRKSSYNQEKLGIRDYLYQTAFFSLIDETQGTA